MGKAYLKRKSRAKRIPQEAFYIVTTKDLPDRPKRKYRGKHNYSGKNKGSQKHAEWRYKSSLYYAKNKAKVSIRMKAYYKKNKAKILERNKAYGQKNYDMYYNRIVPRYRQKKEKESIKLDNRGARYKS